jgi:pimeloyl-ACP methyl ester carboxylesterase
MIRRERTASRRGFLILACGLFLILFFAPNATSAQADWPRIAISRDGTPISYEALGRGEPTLVFVHGWSCDARYWREQVSHFSKRFRVVTLDLAGHGHSGVGREKYTMASFGEDVKAVTDAVGSRRVILIGHSMGGSVIAEAARLMPDRVIGLIGVDTLENVEYPMTGEELEAMVAPFEKNFVEACRGFVGEMMSTDSDPELHEWILADMSSAPPPVAVSAMREMLSQFVSGEAARIFEPLRIPVISVNGGLWPIDIAANRRHMLSYDAIVLEKADHFLMMNREKEFNRALEKAIRRLQKAADR